MTSTTRIKGGCATVAQRLRNRLTAFLGISDPKSARIELGLSLGEIGIKLGEAHPNGHGGRAYSKSTVCHWERGDYRMTPATQAAYLALIDKLVSDSTGGRLAVKVRFGRTWRITALMVCECGRAFRFKRITDKHCPKCRR